MKFYTLLIISLILSSAPLTAENVKNSKKGVKIQKTQKAASATLAKAIKLKSKSAPQDNGPVFYKGIPFEAQSMADDAWVTPDGSFDLRQKSGRAMYYFFDNKYYHTMWVFVDDAPVGGELGWTYRERGTNLHMFFSSETSSNGKFRVLYSNNNKNFRFFSWSR